MMSRLKTFLENSLTGWLCLFIAIANRTVSILYASYAGGDKMSLVVQSRNLLEGRGLCIPKYFIANTDQPFYDYTQLWPPGYSLLLAPFLKFFNYDLYKATTLLDLFICIGFIFVVRKICRQIQFPPIAVNAMTLIAGCFEYPFISESLPTDTISLLFFLLGLSYSIKLAGENKFSYLQVFLTGFLLFLPGFFRYAYPPLSLAVPALIFLYGWKTKNNPLIRKGLWTTAITASLLVIFFIIMKSVTGQTVYITPTERGIFPENIIRWFPFVPASFIDLPFFTSQVIKRTGFEFVKQMEILEIINVFSVLALSFIFFYFLFAKKQFNKMTPFRWFILFGWVCSALIFLTLGYLSFTYGVQKRFLNNWNYIYEPRYFAFVYLLIQLLFTGWVFMNNSRKHSLWQKAIIIAVSFLLIIEVAHSIYFNTRVALHFSQYKSAVYREQDYSYFKTFLFKLEKENPGKDIFVAAPNDKCYLYIAAYYGKKGIFDGAGLKSSVPVVKNNSLLIVMLFDHEIPDYESFLSGNKARHIHRIFNSNFFLLELYPVAFQEK